MNLVIVESPAKAKTIEKFLGGDYKVSSSYGHIRDLKKHEFSIDVEHDFAPIYEIPDDKKDLVEDLKKAAKKAETVWLASDEDREGEAISWHLYEVLGLKPENTKRIVFHEITKPAILAAINNPRNIDLDLVNAQQARRVLDRIVGFELSPILWRKVKPALSAGRVQSVAVRLIVEREREIENFKPEESYRVTGVFAVKDAQGQITLLNAELSKRFATLEEATAFLERAKDSTYSVGDVIQRPLRRQPAPPFTTSTLQQEAARKLHFSVTQTMSIAQRLYESGLITYMRTDSVNLSSLCLDASKQQIQTTMGPEYLEIRHYQTHSKGAQEAHEAIRPTYMDQVQIEGTAVEQRLYDLIWKRTIASQMADAQIEKTTIQISISGEDELHFDANGEVIKFDGFLKVYIESNDDDADEGANSSRLPAVTVGQPLTLNSADALQRFTYQPSRFTEASLVKKMEELGIGRPSTYAPTISTIQAREYVRRSERTPMKRELTHIHLENGELTTTLQQETYANEKGKLEPTDIGIVVNDFLTEHFPEIMSYNFTANVEEDFDKVAEGEEKWTACIKQFYKVFHPLVNKTIEERSTHKAGERVLGLHPDSGHHVTVKISRYGPVVQIGTQEETKKPLFAALQKGQSLATITLEEALKLFELPKDLGEYEESVVTVGMGKFGPYVRHNGKYVSMPKDKVPQDLTLEEAVALIEQKRSEDRARIMKVYSEDPDLQMINGPYGPYLSRGGKNYRLPKMKDREITSLTFEECLNIMEQADNDAAKQPQRKSAGRRSKKSDESN